MKPEKKISNSVWLELRGYRVVVLKPEFAEHAGGLERAIQEGIAAYPDMARADFYDVVLEEGWAYIHIYRDRRVAYLVTYSAVRGEDQPRIPPIAQTNLQNWRLVVRPAL